MARSDVSVSGGSASEREMSCSGNNAGRDVFDACDGVFVDPGGAECGAVSMGTDRDTGAMCSPAIDDAPGCADRFSASFAGAGLVAMTAST